MKLKPEKRGVLQLIPLRHLETKINYGTAAREHLIFEKSYKSRNNKNRSGFKTTSTTSWDQMKMYRQFPG